MAESEQFPTDPALNSAPENPALERLDETPDEAFYRQPRFVTHIDEGAIAAVTQLYREFFPPDAAVLDLMSSWVSHLPPEVPYPRVVGLGLNRAELERNPRLSSFVVQNLNQNPLLPFATGEFGAAGVTVSIDYLTRPAEVLREVGRVLKPGAPIVVSFSNRCFPTKATLEWHGTDDAGHLRLVAGYLAAAGNWQGVQLLDRSPMRGGRKAGDPLYAVVARSAGPDRR